MAHKDKKRLLHKGARGQVVPIPLVDIVPSRWQARRQFDPESLRELALSIQEHGLINPPLAFQNESAEFELIAGERRWRACLALGLMEVSPGGKNLTGMVGMAAENPSKVINLIDYHVDVNHAPAGQPTMALEVREGDPDAFHTIAIVENLQREDVSPIEEAEAFNVLMMANDWTQSALAEHLGKSAAYVSQRLSLLDLAEEVKDATAAGAISFTAARAISTVPEPAQGVVAGMVEKSLTSADPASSRQVANMAGAVRRFLEAERWQPADDEKTTPITRNRFRLLRYHIGYLMTHDPERAAEAVQELGQVDGFNQRYLNKKPATIAGTDYQTVAVLEVLAKAGADIYGGVGPWWDPYAKLKGHTCEACRCFTVAPPDLSDYPDRVHCPRWDGKKTVITCPGWLGAEDPVWLKVDYTVQRAVKGEGAPESGAGIEIVNHNGRYYLADVGQYRLALEIAAEVYAARIAEERRQETDGWRDTMREYWQAQPAGLGSPFDLANAQAHACRLCAEFRPELETEHGAACRYAAEPLTGGHSGKPYSPRFAVLVRADGVAVPRCERFRAAEVPTLDPVRGVRFPTDKAGRALVLDWLRAATINSSHPTDHTGALVGPLAWLPNDRPDGWLWDRDLVARYVRDHWRECGGDRGVARLISVAIYETKARCGRPPFELMNPITGEVHRWIAVTWARWMDGGRISPGMYGIPGYWPQPWAEASPGGEELDQSDPG